MHEDGNGLYGYLKSNLTADSLKELSLKIIEAYKSRDMLRLRLFAESVLQQPVQPEEKGNRLFLKLIKYFHPDRLNFILNDIEQAFRSKDTSKLRFYKDLLSADMSVERAYAQRLELELPEVYRYSEDDVGYSVSDEGDMPLDEYQSEVEEQFDILRAVKTAYLGNLELALDPSDLSSFEGDLDLSDFNVYELDGLQYCRNITSLNLSHNHISSIYHIQYLNFLEELFISNNHISDLEYLRGLSNLEIIDLSNNEVEDISTLLDLENLQFVNLENNPIGTRDLIDKLAETAVVVA
jgi:hypothetical protein